MKKKLTKIIMGALLVALALASFSCGSTQVSKADRAGNFVKGATLWANTCQRCHNLRDPKDFDDRRWFVAMQHMRNRGGLTGQDTRDILAFLRASN